MEDIVAKTKNKKIKNKVKQAKNNKKRKDKRQDMSSFVGDAGASVRDKFAQTVSLRDFRETEAHLDTAGRVRLVEQALVMLEENYVHLPLKQAMHATDPVQRLKLLKYRIEDDSAPLTDLQFHREMTEIFMSVRDLHTNYMLPDPFRGKIAFVPFMIEEFGEPGDDRRRYLVTNVSDGFDSPPFGPGVEVISWNGVPIERAVEIQGNRFAGSNLEARRARGVATMTVRPIVIALPPDEDRVIVGYIDANGVRQELRTDWLVISAPVAPGEILPPPERDAEMRIAAATGMDMELHAVQHVNKYLFAGHAVADEERIANMAANIGRREIVAAQGLGRFVPTSVMEGRTVDTDSGSFGYIRIRSFSYESSMLNWIEVVQSYVDRFIELAEDLPQEGLIVDVRGNGGGIIMAGERLLQLMTSSKIHPEPTQFINTPLNLKICERHDFLTDWVESIREAVRTGAQYSRGFPITSVEEANDTGQRYHGPVVLITDGLCYSTTDIFAAGFQDHDIGPIIGVHDNTGAGGANVWTHDLLSRFLPSTVDGSPYRQLPNNAGMRTSIRRTMRVLGNSGTPVEDLGVVPDHSYDMTRNDLLNSNADLINFAGQVLGGMPVRKLLVKSVGHVSGDTTVTVETLGLDGCDVFINGRAQGSADLSDGETTLTVANLDNDPLELRGFDGDAVVATRRI